MIYGILKGQGFKEEETEEEESIPPLLKVDNKDFEGKHFNDMVEECNKDGHVQHPTPTSTQLKFLDREIKSLKMDVDYHTEFAQKLAERRDMLILIVKTLKRSVQEASSQGERVSQDREIDEKTIADSEGQDAQDAVDTSKFEEKLHKFDGSDSSSATD
ncbi:unnamed protein product [Cuscuta campestris]|uniref:Uncharacterized protein n=1 Tax=Cuscuta campestris TaxID=132261 RepID=A0A484N2W7_9ASTE|nr:unnamed protein product [Cuscuta campestris]